VAEKSLKTIILGLGNPILSDDGIGCRVAAELKERIKKPDVKVVEAAIAGLELIDILTGYDRAIVIDAIQTEKGTPGNIYRFGPEALANTRHTGNPHSVNFATALELGKKLDIKMPQEIIFYAIEAEDVTSFSEECTPAVKKALPECVKMVMQELELES
jgi:hydrogenase maturation protease